MKNLLNTVKAPVVQRSFFDMSHEHKTTFNMGQLIPVMAKPVVPTDKVHIGVDSVIRFQPMLAPIMHLVNVYTHTFFVPYRLLWRGNTQNNRWNDFIANIKTLGVLPQVPTLTFDNSNTQIGTLANYLRIPVIAGTNSYDLTAFNHAAYQCIWNEYYRDENLQTEVNYLLTDGANDSNTELFEMRYRCWEKDYFTAALPFAQKGDPVSIPLGEVELKPTGSETIPGAFRPYDNYTAASSGDVSAALLTGAVHTSGDNKDAVYDPQGTLQVGSTTINDLRLAYTLQRWYEQLARGGTRPNEFLKVIFGIDSPDKRLQRPEYICGSKSPCMVETVHNTTGTEENVQGNMSGEGIGITKGKQGSYYVQEFGVVMTIMSVVPKTNYYQGIPKEYRKTNDPTQYYMPTFDHLGEQEVLNSEIYADHTTPDGTFGYLPRYCEYKYPVNVTTGEFQTNLLFWHLARKFDSSPQLSSEFVAINPETTKRIFAVEDIAFSSLIASVWNDIKIVRPMSKYSTPTF